MVCKLRSRHICSTCSEIPSSGHAVRYLTTLAAGLLTLNPSSPINTKTAPYHAFPAVCSIFPCLSKLDWVRVKVVGIRTKDRGTESLIESRDWKLISLKACPWVDSCQKKATTHYLPNRIFRSIKLINPFENYRSRFL